MVDDCQSPDKCTCLETTILCQNIFATTPILKVLEPEKVTRFYLTNSEIDSLNFLDQFQTLKLFSLHTDVRINCTLGKWRQHPLLSLMWPIVQVTMYIIIIIHAHVCVWGGGEGVHVYATEERKMFNT